MSKYYIANKNNKKKSITILDLNKLEGLAIVPKNKLCYEGIKVNKMVIVDSSIAEKIIKRKIRKKLEYYLKLIIKLATDDDDGDDLNEVLNDLKRYKSIIMHKYKKYLDEKYLNLLLKKIQVIEYEIKSKILATQIKEEIKENTGKHR